jgi:glycosyltransferase involved in cell wall biosynthesis
MKIPRVPITFVIPYIRFGGAELQLISQINYLYDQGHPVSLIVLSRILEFREDLHMPDEQILELKLPSGVLSLSSVWQPFRQMGQIFSFLKTHKTEVVLANLPLSHYIMRLCKLLGKAQGIKFKLLAYHHSLQYAANPLDTAGKKVFNSYNAILANAADDANIFISQACLNDIKAHFPIRNPHVIFNSVPLKQISEEAAAQYVKEHRLPDAKFQLMVGGRLHPSKGHPFFLDVFREFLDKHPHR